MDVLQIKFPLNIDFNGVLCAYEGKQLVPFNIERVFTVSSGVGNIRGDHAHKKCTQLLICLTGSILVTCDNGLTKSKYRINDMSAGLLIPPGIWAKQEYIESNSLMMVLCDRKYEKDDYIKDYEEFKKFKLK